MALHQSIMDGRVRRAYRVWSKPHARAGARHCLNASGAVVIEGVEVIAWRGVADADARAAGYGGKAELQKAMGRHTGITPATNVYCVHFRFEAGKDPRTVLGDRETITVEERAALASKLARMDATSAHGPWTAQTLRLIAEHPKRRAGDLAKMAGRDRLDFKKDVRRLKALGLTISHEVGYEISRRGQAYIAGRLA
jgi:hypothetical protein